MCHEGSQIAYRNVFPAFDDRIDRIEFGGVAGSALKLCVRTLLTQVERIGQNSLVVIAQLIEQLSEAIFALICRLRPESLQKRWTGFKFRQTKSTSRPEILKFANQLIICHVGSLTRCRPDLPEAKPGPPTQNGATPNGGRDNAQGDRSVAAALVELFGLGRADESKGVAVRF